MKILAIAVVILAGAGLSAPAVAANPKLTWVQPTAWASPPVNASGVPNPAAPLVIDHNKIYRGTKADGTNLAEVANLKPAVTQWIDPAPLVGVNCYAVTASVVDPGASQSDLSAVVCTTFTPPPPAPPKPKPPSNFTNQ